jgi:hypothetical protein
MTMRTLTILGMFAVLSVPACGSNDGKAPTTANKKTPSGDDSVAQTTGFKPPALEEGYTRLTFPTVKDIIPGSDVTFCEYAMAPLDHDVDVMDMTGMQSDAGHHAVAFSYTDDGTQEIGSTVGCMGTEFNGSAEAAANMAAGIAPAKSSTLSMGTFLGGVGGPKAPRAVTLPDGVVFRLKKGQGVMLNVHFINTGDEPVDGDAVVDLKLADADPSRLVAAMFLNLDFGFSLSPAAKVDSQVECKAGSDVQLVMFTNHMHEYGTSASTEVIRADSGESVMLHDDPAWSYEMQFNPSYSKWTAQDPFVLKTGDTIRTSCHWNNTEAKTITFPREMCIGVGFALSSGDNPSAPACVGGNWLGTLPGVN